MNEKFLKIESMNCGFLNKIVISASPQAFRIRSLESFTGGTDKLKKRTHSGTPASSGDYKEDRNIPRHTQGAGSTI